MNLGFRRHLWIVAGVMFLTSCQPPDNSSPPHLRFGEDVCATCRMIISEATHAAGRTLPDGRVEGYDDLGCLRKALKDKTAVRADQVDYWVHDFPSHTWIPAASAYFVQSPQFQTPMGYGILAFRDLAKAREYAHNAGSRVQTWDEFYW